MKSGAISDFGHLAAGTTLAFLTLAPVCTFALLVAKGLPSFASDHLSDVIVWSYQVTWIPALGAGLILSGVLRAVAPFAPYYVQPYDFGRCFSLGAIAGALADGLATWSYRLLFHRPINGFWIGGAVITGALAGAGITSIMLYRLTRQKKGRFGR